MKVLLVLALSLAACGGSPPPPVAPVAAKPVTPAPFPYTPDQLRAANPVGRKLRYRVVRARLVSFQEFLFIASDAEGATIQGTAFDEAGAIKGEPKLERTTWTELQAHATFPAEDTTIDDSEITTPVGTLATKLYSVTQDIAGSSSHTLMHFAADPAWAGPPVATAVTVDGEPQLSMELLERTMATVPAAAGSPAAP